MGMSANAFGGYGVLLSEDEALVLVQKTSNYAEKLLTYSGKTLDDVDTSDKDWLDDLWGTLEDKDDFIEPYLSKEDLGIKCTYMTDDEGFLFCMICLDNERMNDWGNLEQHLTYLQQHLNKLGITKDTRFVQKAVYG